MTRTTRTMSVLTISLGALVFLFSGSAVAQQKYTYEHTTSPLSSRYVQQHRIDIGDAPGHQIRIFEVHNQYTRGHPIIRGAKVVETWSRGSSERIVTTRMAKGTFTG
jgi:hypothetical protein